MPREAEPSINERTFLLQALQENIRLDGRPLDAYRNLDISFGDEYGVADVRLGKTRYPSHDVEAIDFGQSLLLTLAQESSHASQPP